LNAIREGLVFESEFRDQCLDVLLVLPLRLIAPCAARVSPTTLGERERHLEFPSAVKRHLFVGCVDKGGYATLGGGRSILRVLQSLCRVENLAWVQRSLGPSRVEILRLDFGNLRSLIFWGMLILRAMRIGAKACSLLRVTLRHNHDLVAQICGALVV